MISKNQIKDIRALHLPKFRQIYNKFIAEGDKVCFEFLKSSKFVIDLIYVVPEYAHKVSLYPNIHNYKLEVISQNEMNQISGLVTPSGILMVIDKVENNIDILKNETLSAIFLDGVQDPGNVGTIIRIADWFGIDCIIRSKDSADFFNPKVVQATMGSIVNTLLCTSELHEISKYRDCIYGAFMNGSPFSKVNIRSNGILVLGSEGSGISPENENIITQKINIPGSYNKTAESLNVAIAAGIICAHWKASNLQ